MEKSAAKLIAVAIVVLLAVDGLAVYTLMNNGGDDPEGYVTVTDIRGREVKVPSNVDKIVCNAAGTLRVVSYLGAHDMVVGKDASDSSSTPNNDYATYLIAYDYSKVANVGNADNETSYKAISESGAQVIISSKATVEELNTIQEKTRIPVIGIDAGGSLTITEENFRKNIEIVGKAIGKEQRAKELLSAVDAIINELESYSSSTSHDVKSYIGGLSYYKQSGLYMTSGNYLPFILGGAKNVMPFEKGLPYDIKIPSRLVEADPSHIFIDSITRNESKTQYNEQKEILKNITALKNGNDYLVFAAKYYGTNWETELMNAYFIGHLLHPEAYDYNLEEKLNHVLDVFFEKSDITVKKISEKQGWSIGGKWL